MSLGAFGVEWFRRRKQPGCVLPNMEIITKDVQKITRFKASGASGEGDGKKAGTAYRIKDGSMVYVPAVANDPKP